MFRHIARKSWTIQEVFPAIFRQSDENSDCAICAPELCGVALKHISFPSPRQRLRTGNTTTARSVDSPCRKACINGLISMAPGAVHSLSWIDAASLSPFIRDGDYSISPRGKQPEASEREAFRPNVQRTAVRTPGSAGYSPDFGPCPEPYVHPGAAGGTTPLRFLPKCRQILQSRHGTGRPLWDRCATS